MARRKKKGLTMIDHVSTLENPSITDLKNKIKNPTINLVIIKPEDTSIFDRVQNYAKNLPDIYQFWSINKDIQTLVPELQQSLVKMNLFSLEDLDFLVKDLAETVSEFIAVSGYRTPFVSVRIFGAFYGYRRSRRF